MMLLDEHEQFNSDPGVEDRAAALKQGLQILGCCVCALLFSCTLTTRALCLKKHLLLAMPIIVSLVRSLIRGYSLHFIVPLAKGRKCR